MQFRSVKRSDFTGGARAVARNMDQVFRANRDSAIDFTMLAKESIKGRSQERRAAMEAESAVARAGLKAFADVKETKTNAKTAKEILEIKKPAQRMAGVVGALGTLSGYALMAKNAKEDKAWRDERDRRDAERDQQMIELIKGATTQNPYVPGERPVTPKPDFLPVPEPSSDSSTTDSTGDSTSDTSGNTSTPRNMSAQVDLSNLTDDDYSHLAYVITSEAGGGNDMYGVAASILNRVSHEKFPGTVKDVIFAPGQYKGVIDGNSTWDPKIAAQLKSPEGQKQLQNAFSVLDGRTDFKGQTLLHNRSNKGNKDYDGDGVPDKDPMFHSSGNYYHYHYQ